MVQQRLRDGPIVIKIDLTDEFSNIWLQATPSHRESHKSRQGAAAKMEDIERESPQISLGLDKLGAGKRGIISWQNWKRILDAKDVAE